MAFIDTSVLVSYYHPEPLSAAAQKAVEEADDPTISRLVELEFCSACALKTRTGELALDLARRILEELRSHIEEGRYLVVPLTGGEYSTARQWLSRLDTSLRAPDALHLAAAFINNMTLLTADRSLAASARSLGVEYELIH